ncbi:L-asparaginase [Pseudoxanthobacter soli DSM 19599]|uniref:L-asparaginase n=1 Tax=Pseudoxanthobacter soli DSM 19599 TaxID=1123029 RepID=A0A1M7ZMN2_9HYPH|nr:asparaginase [Pseudoxanthobacter soli]SHO66163.1 L-asparaginase [Pseudoxanthobacter soli DSM 19599]
MADTLPRIVILATGGTIAGAADPRSQSGYNAGEVSAESLIASVPGIEALARLSAEQVASIGSQDMNDAVWFGLARRIDLLARSPEVDGIVVTHGTDTLEETALFLDLVVETDKPVVLVGAMRPSTAISADGPLNIHEAVQVAGSPQARGRGVLVVLNDTIHGARDVTKTSTTSVQTFQSPNCGPVGLVNPNMVAFHAPPAARTVYPLPALPPLPPVDIVVAHAGMGARQVQDAVAAGVKGIVLAGVGDGNAAKPAIDALAAAAARGIVVVRSSRVGSGPVMRNIEIDDDTPGFVAAGSYNPAKARVLLQVLLANGIDAPAEVQAAFVPAP